MRELPIYMVIFNSYVILPEGIMVGWLTADITRKYGRCFFLVTGDDTPAYNFGGG